MLCRLPTYGAFVLGLLLTAGCERAALDSPKPAHSDGLFSPGILRFAIDIAKPELDTSNNPDAARDFDSAVARFCEAIARRSHFVAKQLKAPASD